MTVISASTASLGDVDREATASREVSDPAWYWRAATVVAAVGIYVVYRGLRVGAGRAVFDRGLPVRPFDNAMNIIAVERALWIDVEQGVQHIFLGFGWLIRFCNGYYSWSHQVFTLGLVVAVTMRSRWSDALRWVGALLLLLPAGLVLFKLYPLMPPRLLDAGAPWGGRLLQAQGGHRPTGIIDTLVTFPGPWSPGSVPVSSFTNQYAAMPSLHCAFSLWVGIVWWQWRRGRSWRMLGPAHAALVFFCTVVTGNHFVLDAVVGWALTIICLAATNRFRWLRSFRAQLRERDLVGDDPRRHESINSAYTA